MCPRPCIDEHHAKRSVVAVWQPHGTSTIKDFELSFTPSVVAYTNRGERLVGDIARRQQAANPKNTVRHYSPLPSPPFASYGRDDVTRLVTQDITLQLVCQGHGVYVKQNVPGESWQPARDSCSALHVLAGAQHQTDHWSPVRGPRGRKCTAALVSPSPCFDW